MAERRAPAVRRAARSAGRDGGGGRPASIVAAAALTLGFLAVATLAWVAAFYATTWFYGRIGAHPSPLEAQLVGALTGLVFLSVPMIAFGQFQQVREVQAFRSLLAAMRHIAKGDFAVRLEPSLAQGRHPFSQLAVSVNDMAEELDRMERLRQEFISNVSHELQSPLTAIRGFARVLADDSLDAGARHRYLAIIEAEGERLSRLGDNLLRLTALDTDEPPLEPRPYRLDRQIQRVLLASEPAWAAKGIDVVAELAPETIVADEALLAHVWANVVQNAVKFTATGGALTIRLGAADDGFVAVAVSDTGIGIAAEDQARIFERFFKVDRARSPDAGGSGLGLALVRRIVELHAGEVRVRSSPGEGATFTVSLPREGPPRA